MKRGRDGPAHHDDRPRRHANHLQDGLISQTAVKIDLANQLPSQIISRTPVKKRKEKKKGQGSNKVVKIGC